MLKYLIIQLCDSAPSLCHYSSAEKPRLIPLDELRAGLQWAIKSGLSIQVVYPDYELSAEYDKLLGEYDHVTIGKGCDIETIATVDEVSDAEVPVVLRLKISDFLANYLTICKYLHKFSRLNILFTDVDKFSDNQIDEYSKALDALADELFNIYKTGGKTQLNLVSDRMLLTKMNNCNAGDETITLAPDGNFYVCPGFYFNGEKSVGNLSAGLNIPNKQLYQLKYAPICRKCEAWHCKRCVWLNKKMTLEVNTPSHEQCVMAHLERESSRKLLTRVREVGEFMPEVEIPEIDYLDPFNKVEL